MRKKEFELLLTDVIREYGASYIELPEGKYDKPHEFSAGFERKMRRLIRRERRFYFPLVKTPIRRAVTVLLTVTAALMAAVMSVAALREPFLHFIMEIFGTHTNVRTLEYGDAPMFIEALYEVTELPEGMELIAESETGNYHTMMSRNYKKGDLFLYFRQYIKSEYEQNVDTEGHEMQTIDIDGKEGFLVDFDGEYAIVWDNGDYIFYMHGNIDKNSIISAAKSVEKVE